MQNIESFSQDQIRETNKNRILKVFTRKRKLTRIEIARETGISIPTITNNLRSLMDDGIISEVGKTESSSGRKASILEFNPDSRMAFGVDFSSNHLRKTGMIRFMLTNLDMKVIHEESFPYNSFPGINEIMEHLSNRFLSILEENCVDTDKILGVCFSLPGIINEKDKILEKSPNMSTYLGIDQLDFKNYTKLFPFPLEIENEAITAAFAEMGYEGISSYTSLVYIAVNRGISAGLVIGGKIYKGGNSKAGLLGHLFYKESEEICTCGNNGCWELFVGTGALIRNYRKLTGETLESTRDFYFKLVKGDSDAFAVWNIYLEDFSRGIVNILISYDPVNIIIGGEISLFEDFLLIPIKEKLSEHNNFQERESINIEIGRKKNNASLLGAAMIPIQAFFTNSKSLYLSI